MYICSYETRTTLVVYMYVQISICGRSCGGSDHCACLTGSDRKWRDRKRPCLEVTWLFPSIFFPYFFSPYFFPYSFPRTFSLYFFPRTYFPGTFSRTYFSRIFFPLLFPRVLFFLTFFSRTFFFRIFFLYFATVLFFSYNISRTIVFPYYFPVHFSKVVTFEIQRFQLSVSCFSSTCRYITVHVPCGIAKRHP